MYSTEVSRQSHRRLLGMGRGVRAGQPRCELGHQGRSSTGFADNGRDGRRKCVDYWQQTPPGLERFASPNRRGFFFGYHRLAVFSTQLSAHLDSRPDLRDGYQYPRHT